MSFTVKKKSITKIKNVFKMILVAIFVNLSSPQTLKKSFQKTPSISSPLIHKIPIIKPSINPFDIHFLLSDGFDCLRRTIFMYIEYRTNWLTMDFISPSIYLVLLYFYAWWIFELVLESISFHFSSFFYFHFNGDGLCSDELICGCLVVCDKTYIIESLIHLISLEYYSNIIISMRYGGGLYSLQ